ncbi:MAG: magnesium-translocating P-type ATPase [Candidatus Parcubacteria bacterium]|nr:magnesium-translocating P-type ATPase [Candidatus Parcubacteria bacterium]
MSNNDLLKYIDFKPEDIYRVLKSNAEGLTSLEVKKRQKLYGLNVLSGERRFNALEIFISQFKNPLILILLIATLISGFLGEYVSATIIFVMVFVSAILAFIQEYNSAKIIETLKNKVALQSTVIRDGKPRKIVTTDLVVGDVVLLQSSSIIPADLRLVESHDLAVNQAILSGEAFPVEKNSEPVNARKQLLDAPNLVFAGSHVVQGSGKAIVAAIGKDTFLGQTAKLLTEVESPSEFQRGISQFGYFLFKIIIFFSFAVFLILALFKGNWLEALLFSLAIAVGISPELLPIIITINLSRGARLMAKNQVVVKRLMAIENLGNADVLCTDKTGTLTEGKIELKDFFDFDGQKNENILFLGSLCNSYAIDKNSAANPLDKAIIDYAQKNLKKHNGYKIVENIPFDFYRRRMSVIVSKNGGRELICKGASAEMLKICSSILVDNKIENLAGHLAKVKDKIENLESVGFRIILLAQKEIDTRAKYKVADENKMVLLGALVFIDPPKKTAAESIRIFNDLGVSVKILTGDNEMAAKRLAEEINYKYSKLVVGSEIEKMSDERLQKIVYGIDVFVKVTPEHKLKIVKALKASGHNVAFLGDGVNDAPALRAADVGISVEGAVDVAKEAADVILLKKSLNVLIYGIKEGRKTFGNTLKYILCTISSNYGNMFTVVGASLFLPFIPMLPVQIILLNFFSDMPMLAIASDEVDEEYIKKPKQWDIKKIKQSMNYFGLLSSVMDYVTFGFLIFIINAPMTVFQSGWFWQSYLTEVLLIFVIRTKKWFWQSKPSKALSYATLITTVLVILVLFTGLRNYFNFGLLNYWQALAIVGIAIIYFLMVEFVKKYIYKKFDI